MRQVGAVVLVALVAWVADYAATQPSGTPPPVIVAEAAPAVGGWEVDVLRAIGNEQPTQETVNFLSAWHRAEGGNATFNWLNTTQPAAGDSLYNSVGVRNYPDYQTGVEATARTLTNGYYPRTLYGLQANAPVVDDAEMGTWGTGGGAMRRQLEETQDGGSQSVSLPSAFTSNPISTDGDCGWNVVVALEANSGALKDVRLAPGQTFSFNASIGNPDRSIVPWRYCAGVEAGNWCNLAARYAQVGRALGLALRFDDHGLGDLGGGAENSVLIWSVGGQSGFENGAHDLLIQNTQPHPVWFQARDIGGAVVIEGGSE